MRIVVAGVGAMGLPMATALLSADFSVVGFDVLSKKAYTDARLPMLSHPAEIQADVMLVVVRDARQINALCFDEQAVYAAQHYPRTIIINSTVSVTALQKIAARLPADVTIIDAPMSGAPIAAIERRLTFMLGGSDEKLDQLMPLFNAMGSKHFRLGVFGRGMLAKTLNNTVAATSVVAVRRALADAARAGMDAQTLLQVMSASSGSTWFGDAFSSISFARENYSPDNTIGIIEKDVLCAQDGLHRKTDAFDVALLEALRSLPDFPKQ